MILYYKEKFVIVCKQGVKNMEKNELINHANNLLERTKNNIEKYKEERKILFNYIERPGEIDFYSLENYLNVFQEYLNIQEYLSKVEELKEIIIELANQQNRKNENNERIKVFKVLDKQGKEYMFLSRIRMNDFMQKNQELFDLDVQIELVENTNIDLEKILNLLEKIF